MRGFVPSSIPLFTLNYFQLKRFCSNQLTFVKGVIFKEWEQNLNFSRKERALLIQGLNPFTYEYKKIQI